MSAQHTLIKGDKEVAPNRTLGSVKVANQLFSQPSIIGSYSIGLLWKVDNNTDYTSWVQDDFTLGHNGRIYGHHFQLALGHFRSCKFYQVHVTK